MGRLVILEVLEVFFSDCFLGIGVQVVVIWMLFSVVVEVGSMMFLFLVE